MRTTACAGWLEIFAYIYAYSVGSATARAAWRRLSRHLMRIFERLADIARYVALRPLAGDGVAFDHIMHSFGDVGGVVADALDVLGAEQMVDVHGDGARVLHRI